MLLYFKSTTNQCTHVCLHCNITNALLYLAVMMKTSDSDRCRAHSPCPPEIKYRLRLMQPCFGDCDIYITKWCRHDFLDTSSIMDYWEWIMFLVQLKLSGPSLTFSTTRSLSHTHVIQLSSTPPPPMHDALYRRWWYKVTADRLVVCVCMRLKTE